MVCSDISHVAFVSVLLGENPSEEVDDYDNYYYEFIARNDGFWRAPEIDFRYETKARKVMVDFKFDALAIQLSPHIEHPEVRLVKKLTRSLY